MNRAIDPVRCLSFHRTYGCRHRGVCCSSDWPIPVESDRLAVIEAAVAAGRLRPAAGGAAFDRPPDAAGDTPALLSRAGGRCVFHAGPRVARCAIHATLGHDALPLACRQFPRITVIDPRGVSVTLSHYCPTAASLLDEPGAPTAIDDAPPAFPPAGEYVGLDVRDALPPLVRPNLLMDWDSWWTLEALVVDTLANGDGDSGARLARVREAIALVGAWRPGPEPLMSRVRRAASATTASRSGPSRSPSAAAILTAVPLDLRRHVPQPSIVHAGTETRSTGRFVPEAPSTGRFLAAHAFANWTAHLGTGLRSWEASIGAAWTLLRTGYSPGDADLILRHLADQTALTALFDRTAAGT